MVLPTVQLLQIALISGLLLLLTSLAGLLIVTTLITLIKTALMTLGALEVGIRTATSIARALETAARSMIVVKCVRVLESLHNRTILPKVSVRFLWRAMPWTGLIQQLLKSMT